MKEKISIGSNSVSTASCENSMVTSSTTPISSKTSHDHSVFNGSCDASTHSASVCSPLTLDLPLICPDSVKSVNNNEASTHSSVSSSKSPRSPRKQRPTLEEMVSKLHHRTEYVTSPKASDQCMSPRNPSAERITIDDVSTLTSLSNLDNSFCELTSKQTDRTGFSEVLHLPNTSWCPETCSKLAQPTEVNIGSGEFHGLLVTASDVHLTKSSVFKSLHKSPEKNKNSFTDSVKQYVDKQSIEQDESVLPCSLLHSTIYNDLQMSLERSMKKDAKQEHFTFSENIELTKSDSLVSSSSISSVSNSINVSVTVSNCISLNNASPCDMESDIPNFTNKVEVKDVDSPEIVCLSSSPGASSNMFTDSPSDTSQSSLVHIADAVAAILSSNTPCKSPNFRDALGIVLAGKESLDETIPVAESSNIFSETNHSSEKSTSNLTSDEIYTSSSFSLGSISTNLSKNFVSFCSNTKETESSQLSLKNKVGCDGNSKHCCETPINKDSNSVLDHRISNKETDYNKSDKIHTVERTIGLDLSHNFSKMEMKQFNSKTKSDFCTKQLYSECKSQLKSCQKLSRPLLEISELGHKLLGVVQKPIIKKSLDCGSKILLNEQPVLQKNESLDLCAISKSNCVRSVSSPTETSLSGKHSRTSVSSSTPKTSISSTSVKTKLSANVKTVSDSTLMPVKICSSILDEANSCSTQSKTSSLSATDKTSSQITANTNSPSTQAKTSSTPAKTNSQITAARTKSPSIPAKTSSHITACKTKSPLTPTKTSSQIAAAKTNFPLTSAKTSSSSMPVKISSHSSLTKTSTSPTPVRISSPSTPAKTSSPSIPAKPSFQITAATAKFPSTPAKTSTSPMLVKISSPSTPTKSSTYSTPVRIGSPSTPAKTSSSSTSFKFSSTSTPVKTSLSSNYVKSTSCSILAKASTISTIGKMSISPTPVIMTVSSASDSLEIFLKNNTSICQVSTDTSTSVCSAPKEMCISYIPSKINSESTSAALGFSEICNKIEASQELTKSTVSLLPELSVSSSANDTCVSSSATDTRMSSSATDTCVSSSATDTCVSSSATDTKPETCDCLVDLFTINESTSTKICDSLISEECHLSFKLEDSEDKSSEQCSLLSKLSLTDRSTDTCPGFSEDNFQTRKLPTVFDFKSSDLVPMLPSLKSTVMPLTSESPNKPTDRFKSTTLESPMQIKSPKSIDKHILVPTATSATDYDNGITFDLKKIKCPTSDGVSSEKHQDFPSQCSNLSPRKSVMASSLSESIQIESLSSDTNLIALETDSENVSKKPVPGTPLFKFSDQEMPSRSTDKHNVIQSVLEKRQTLAKSDHIPISAVLVGDASSLFHSKSLESTDENSVQSPDVIKDTNVCVILPKLEGSISFPKLPKNIQPVHLMPTISSSFDIDTVNSKKTLLPKNENTPVTKTLCKVSPKESNEEKCTQLKKNISKVIQLKRSNLVSLPDEESNKFIPSDGCSKPNHQSNEHDTYKCKTTSVLIPSQLIDIKQIAAVSPVAVLDSQTLPINSPSKPQPDDQQLVCDIISSQKSTFAAAKSTEKEENFTKNQHQTEQQARKKLIRNYLFKREQEKKCILSSDNSIRYVEKEAIGKLKSNCKKQIPNNFFISSKNEDSKLKVAASPSHMLNLIATTLESQNIELDLHSRKSDLINLEHTTSKITDNQPFKSVPGLSGIGTKSTETVPLIETVSTSTIKIVSVSMAIVPKSLKNVPSGSIETATKSIETSPKSIEIGLKHVETAPKSVETAFQSIETTPKSIETAPKSIEIVQKPIESITKSTETILTKSIENISKSAENILKSAENISKSAENISKSVENISKSTENVFKLIENDPKSTETVITSTATIPKSKETGNTSTESIPKSTKTASKSTGMVVNDGIAVLHTPLLDSEISKSASKTVLTSKLTVSTKTTKFSSEPLDIGSKFKDAAHFLPGKLGITETTKSILNNTGFVPALESDLKQLEVEKTNAKAILNFEEIKSKVLPELPIRIETGLNLETTDSADQSVQSTLPVSEFSKSVAKSSEPASELPFPGAVLATPICKLDGFAPELTKPVSESNRNLEKSPELIAKHAKPIIETSLPIIINTSNLIKTAEQIAQVAGLVTETAKSVIRPAEIDRNRSASLMDTTDMKENIAETIVIVEHILAPTNESPKYTLEKHCGATNIVKSELPMPDEVCLNEVSSNIITFSSNFDLDTPSNQQETATKMSSNITREQSDLSIAQRLTASQFVPPKPGSRRTRRSMVYGYKQDKRIVEMTGENFCVQLEEALAAQSACPLSKGGKCALCNETVQFLSTHAADQHVCLSYRPIQRTEAYHHHTQERFLEFPARYSDQLYGEPYYICATCGLATKRMTLAWAHIDFHPLMYQVNQGTNKESKCNCLKTSYSFNLHKWKTLLSKTLQCYLCNSRFICAEGLESHLKIVHRNIKNTCLQCQETDIDNIIQHNGEHSSLISTETINNTEIHSNSFVPPPIASSIYNISEMNNVPSNVLGNLLNYLDGQHFHLNTTDRGADPNSDRSQISLPIFNVPDNFLVDEKYVTNHKGELTRYKRGKYGIKLPTQDQHLAANFDVPIQMLLQNKCSQFRRGRKCFSSSVRAIREDDLFSVLRLKGVRNSSVDGSSKTFSNANKRGRRRRTINGELFNDKLSNDFVKPNCSMSNTRTSSRKVVNKNLTEEDAVQDHIGLSNHDINEGTLKVNDIPSISGEWSGEHTFVCCGCGAVEDDLAEIMDHKWARHTGVLCAHTMITGKPGVPVQFCEQYRPPWANNVIVPLPDTSQQDEKIRNLTNTPVSIGNKETTQYTTGSSKAKLKTDIRSDQANLFACTKCKLMNLTRFELHAHIVECGGLAQLYTARYIKRNKKTLRFRRRKGQGIPSRHGINTSTTTTPQKRREESGNATPSHSSGVKRRLVGAINSIDNSMLKKRLTDIIRANSNPKRRAIGVAGIRQCGRMKLRKKQQQQQLLQTRITRAVVRQPKQPAAIADKKKMQMNEPSHTQTSTDDKSGIQMTTSKHNKVVLAKKFTDSLGSDLHVENKTVVVSKNSLQSLIKKKIHSARKKLIKSRTLSKEADDSAHLRPSGKLLTNPTVVLAPLTGHGQFAEQNLPAKNNVNKVKRLKNVRENKLSKSKSLPIHNSGPDEKSLKELLSAYCKKKIGRSSSTGGKNRFQSKHLSRSQVARGKHCPRHNVIVSSSSRSSSRVSSSTDQAGFSSASSLDSRGSSSSSVRDVLPRRLRPTRPKAYSFNDDSEDSEPEVIHKYRTSSRQFGCRPNIRGNNNNHSIRYSSGPAKDSEDSDLEDGASCNASSIKRALKRDIKGSRNSTMIETISYSSDPGDYYNEITSKNTFNAKSTTTRLTSSINKFIKRSRESVTKKLQQKQKRKIKLALHSTKSKNLKSRSHLSLKSSADCKFLDLEGQTASDFNELENVTLQDRLTGSITLTKSHNITKEGIGKNKPNCGDADFDDKPLRSRIQSRTPEVKFGKVRRKSALLASELSKKVFRDELDNNVDGGHAMTKVLAKANASTTCFQVISDVADIMKDSIETDVKKPNGNKRDSKRKSGESFANPNQKKGRASKLLNEGDYRVPAVGINRARSRKTNKVSLNLDNSLGNVDGTTSGSLTCMQKVFSRQQTAPRVVEDKEHDSANTDLKVCADDQLAGDISNTPSLRADHHVPGDTMNLQPKLHLHTESVRNPATQKRKKKVRRQSAPEDMALSTPSAPTNSSSDLTIKPQCRKRSSSMNDINSSASNGKKLKLSDDSGINAESSSVKNATKLQSEFDELKQKSEEDLLTVKPLTQSKKNLDFESSRKLSQSNKSVKFRGNTRKKLVSKRKNPKLKTKTKPSHRLINGTRTSVVDAIESVIKGNVVKPKAAIQSKVSIRQAKKAVIEYRCRECGLQFESLEAYNSHDRDVCANIVFGMCLIPEDQLYECPHCLLTFAYKSTQKKHSSACRAPKVRRTASRPPVHRSAALSPVTATHKIQTKTDKLESVALPGSEYDNKKTPDHSIPTEQSVEPDGPQVETCEEISIENPNTHYESVNALKNITTGKELNKEKTKHCRSVKSSKKNMGCDIKAKASRTAASNAKKNQKNLPKKVQAKNKAKPKNTSVRRCKKLKTDPFDGGDIFDNTSPRYETTDVNIKGTAIKKKPKARSRSLSAKCNSDAIDRMSPKTCQVKADSSDPEHSIAERAGVGPKRNSLSKEDTSMQTSEAETKPISDYSVKVDATTRKLNKQCFRPIKPKNSKASILKFPFKTASGHNSSAESNASAVADTTTTGALGTSTEMLSIAGATMKVPTLLKLTSEFTATLCRLGVILQERCSAQPVVLEMTAFMLQYRLSPNQMRIILINASPSLPETSNIKAATQGSSVSLGAVAVASKNTAANDSSTKTLATSVADIDDSNSSDVSPADRMTGNATNKTDSVRALVVRLPYQPLHPPPEESYPGAGAHSWCALLQELVNQQCLVQLHALLIATARRQKDQERLVGADSALVRCLTLNWFREDMIKSVLAIEDIIKQIGNLKAEIIRHQMLVAMKKTFEASTL